MCLNDSARTSGLKLRMAQKPKKNPKPVRANPGDHFIGEWMVYTGHIQAEIVKETGVDKSTVSRWVSGEMIPEKANLQKLADLFGCTINDLFHRPSERDLLSKFRALDKDRQKRFVAVVENAFPD